MVAASCSGRVRDRHSPGWQQASTSHHSQAQVPHYVTTLSIVLCNLAVDLQPAILFSLVFTNYCNPLIS